MCNLHFGIKEALRFSSLRISVLRCRQGVLSGWRGCRRRLSLQREHSAQSVSSMGSCRPPAFGSRCSYQTGDPTAICSSRGAAHGVSTSNFPFEERRAALNFVGTASKLPVPAALPGPRSPTGLSTHREVRWPSPPRSQILTRLKCRRGFRGGPAPGRHQQSSANDDPATLP